MNLRSLALLGLVLAAAPLAAKPAPRRAGPPQIIPLPLKQVIAAHQRLCTARTATGLGYQVLRAGSGARPVGDAAVTVNYIGYLTATGEVFDQATASEFPLNGVIPGFSEGLALMPAGSIYRLCIPARLAYADRSVGPIPANSDLVFQVELLPPVPPVSTRKP
ncbi:MAG: FKBP-type peptidyl-prolyl cis-trans isomerase [Novosphingobium sp.]|uniref:FKBP-type peptidyl-prolyl cis-trans isomerase n=1 Tax=Novosphingobium sp. TaxID=1874826 RepID=UPI0032B738C2